MLVINNALGRRIPNPADQSDEIRVNDSQREGETVKLKASDCGI